MDIIPRITKEKKYEDRREDFSNVAAGHLISLTSIHDKNQEILTAREKEDFYRWIARGKEIITRINPDIFSR